MKDTKRIWESIRNISSQIVTDETRHFHDPVPTEPLDAASSSRKFFKNTRMLVPSQGILSHTSTARRSMRVQNDQIQCNFVRDHIVINQKFKIKDFPKVCNEVEKWFERSNVEDCLGDDLALVDKTEEVAFLNKKLINVMQNEGIRPSNDTLPR